MTDTAGGPNVSPGSGPGAIERPALGNEPGDYWGSDAVALMLRELDIPYVALNPGASYRGLHDSLSICSATATRRCCSACTRSTPSRWRTATPR